jgi:hydrophobe/amphiphile efflux-3 (HAE3) family protein
MRRKMVGFILRHRVTMLALLLAITAVAGYFATRLQFDNSIEIWFREGDEGLARYRDFLDLFESDEFFVVAMAPGQVFTTRNLAYLNRVARRIEGVEHVLRVVSLTNVEIPRAVFDGVVIGPLMNEIPSEIGELEEIRRLAMSSGILSGTLLSPEGDATAIVAQTEHLEGQSDYRLEMIRQVRSILLEESKGRPELHLGGGPVFDEAFFRYTERDFLLFVPVVFFLVTAVILVIFRRPFSVLLPLGVVLLTEVWIFGLIGLLGLKINVISTILAPLLLAVGIADSIHLLSQYYEDLEEGMTKRESIAQAFQNVFAPCLLTTLTTAAGLLSLLTSQLAPLRVFGTLAALGIVLAFVITMVFMPVALSFTKPPSARALASHRTGVLARVLVLFGRIGTRHAGLVMVVSVLLSVAAVYSAMRIEVGTNTMDYFKTTDPIRRAINFIDTRIGGTVSLEFLLEGEQEGAFKEPAALAKMEALSSYLDGIPGVTRTYSIVDHLKEMNRVMHGGNPVHYSLPGTREGVAQYLLLMEGSDDLESMIQDDARIARVSARVRMEDSIALTAKLDEIEQYLEASFTDGLTAKTTGLAKLMHAMEAYLLSSQIRSFSIAFVVILIMMAMMLRSFRLGLFAMIPNFLPVLLTMGIMGAAGFHLDVGTVTIASIILGMVVDDSIHFLHRFREQILRRQDPSEAIRASIQGVGKAIFSTSIILALGFWVLCLGSFRPNIHFGLLSGIAILMALFADLVVLPAAITLLKPKFRFRQHLVSTEILGLEGERKASESV